MALPRPLFKGLLRPRRENYLRCIRVLRSLRPGFRTQLLVAKSGIAHIEAKNAHLMTDLHKLEPSHTNIGCFKPCICM